MTLESLYIYFFHYIFLKICRRLKGFVFFCLIREGREIQVRDYYIIYIWRERKKERNGGGVVVIETEKERESASEWSA